MENSSMSKRLLLFGCFCFAFTLLSGKDIFVSPGGSDKNPGTEKAPFATIAFAVSKALPGDTVKIGPGLYREQITFTRSGKKGSPITLKGTRGKNGEFLTIVEGVGTTLSKWTPAPEIAPDVWKTDLAKRPDLMMMDGKMITYINRSTMALPRMKTLPDELYEDLVWSQFGPNCKRCPGLDLLSLKKDILFRHRYFGKRKELLWPTIGNVMTGWRDGKLYIRFADGDTPAKHTITASYGPGFTLKRASFLNFSDLHMRGSRYQFNITSGSTNNVIDNCLLMHGGARVKIDRGALNNTVQNSILTAGFIRGDLFQLRAENDMRGGVLYQVFKFFIGFSSSDDIGVSDHGTGSKILNNVMLQGLIGSDAYGPECEFAGNVVMGMSSVGICTGARTSGEFHHNLVLNSAIPLRIHNLRHERAKREEYHYKNIYIQAPNDGSQVYVHSASYLYGHDVINFEKGTSKYKKNPPNPVDPGKIFIYHNTFWGGGNWAPGFDVGYLYERFRTPMPFYYVNNVVKGCHRWKPFAQELQAGNLIYGYPNSVNNHPLRYPDMKKDNTLISEKLNGTIWNNKKIPGLYDLTLAKNSPALGVGIDISKPFIYKGKNFPAFPGFKPGYFKGKAPAAGALQDGEDMQLYVDMYRKAEKAMQIIKNAK